jgi:hypothetical protein
MNRRQLFATARAAASLGLFAGIVAGAPGCSPALASEPDPMLKMIQKCRAALAVANSKHTDAEVDAAMVPINALYDELGRRTPTITTELGALEALRFAHETMGHSHEDFLEPMLGAVLAYFSERA